jgi:uncharacterized protein YdhG (YjbR/CyaY superfamily)
MKTAKEVDEYIAQAPADVQGRLKAIRATILAAAPGATERISYGMPTYEYKGRLVYFALWKKHIGVYALTTPVLEAHKSELEGYVTSKGTIQLPLNEAVPLELIERLVRAQVKENDEAANKARKGSDL